MTSTPDTNLTSINYEVVEDVFIITHNDVITNRLQRAQIDEQETLLREAESLAQMGSWKWTKVNDQLRWSDGLYKIVSKNTDEPITWNSFLENVLPEDMQRMKDYLHDIKLNKMESIIYYRIRKDDSLRYFSLTTKPHTAFDILGTVMDITEHKQSEQELEDSMLMQSKVIHELNEKEKRYRTLFERSIDPIFLTTGDFTFISVNQSFLDFIGYHGIDEVSVPLCAIFSNTDDYAPCVAKLKSDGQLRDYEVQMITRSGEKKYCLLNCIFIPDPTESNCCYQGIIHDLTLRKQAEDELLIAERLSLTGKIARTIAHEVRNPLTNINLALDQLRGEFHKTNESATLYSDIIERNAGRIEELMGEMLNTSKLRKLNLELVSVSELLHNALRMAQDRINLNQIQLMVNTWDELPRLLVDRDKIQIAFLNIIINAIEAMTQARGVLGIYASWHDDVVTVEIADNGKGIALSDIKRLFDPFFTCKQNGMGLGLTSTKNILNSHNARVEVNSEIDRGTSFYIHFKLPE